MDFEPYYMITSLFLFPASTQQRGCCNVVIHINFLLVWPRSQISSLVLLDLPLPLYGRRFNILNCTAAGSH